MRCQRANPQTILRFGYPGKLAQAGNVDQDVACGETQVQGRNQALATCKHAAVAVARGQHFQRVAQTGCPGITARRCLHGVSLPIPLRRPPASLIEHLLNFIDQMIYKNRKIASRLLRAV